MKLHISGRGFLFLSEVNCSGQEARLLQESSTVGDYEDNYPGSSYLWVGDDFHLNREQVAELVEHLQRWLDTKTLGGGT